MSAHCEFHVEARRVGSTEHGSTVIFDTLAGARAEAATLDAEHGWCEVRVWRVTTVVTKAEVSAA